MKQIVVAAVILLLVGLAVANFVEWVAVSVNEVHVYPPDQDIPLSAQKPLEVVAPGQEITLLECIDSKSDQYLRVMTPSEQQGYVYSLDVETSLNFTLKAKTGISSLLGCGVFFAR